MIGRVACAVAMLAASAAGADNLALGHALFEPCAACHARVAGKPGMAGPDLARLGGRAGRRGTTIHRRCDGASPSGAAWDRERLARFLADPNEMFPGLWMSAQPMRGDADRQTLAAYLLQDAP